MKPDPTNLGARLRAARNERKWSQETLARAAGITKKAVSKIERGQTLEPKARNIHRLAQALHVSVNWLLYGRTPQANGRGSQLSMLDCELLAALEELTDAQKRELLQKAQDRAEENREIVEALRRADE